MKGKPVIDENVSESEESIADSATEEAPGSGDSANESDLHMDASSTSSDSDNDEDSAGNTLTASKTKAEIIEEQIQNKYGQIKGTRLYVRFPMKLPLDEKKFELKAKSLSPLITKAHKPRQKHARFCLVEFNSKEDRDTALAEIKAATKTDPAFKGIIVSLPKTESDDFVKSLVARKQQSMENKRTKLLMKRATKKMNRKETFTSSIVITNLPKTSSAAEVRKLFNNAVDIQIKPGKGKYRDVNVATVTMPTTFDARNAIKQNLNIGGTKLQFRFNSQGPKRQNRANLKRKPNKDDKSHRNKNNVSTN